MKPTHAFSTWLFLRLLAFVYFCAFASLAVQIVGLVGAHGILSAGVADATLRGVCIAGVAPSIVLVLGFVPILILPLLWGGYLWLSNVSGEFLSYQWDALLLETGLLAVFVAPIRLRERFRETEEPPHVAVWLMLWLLFRLMFGSGAVKLASGDPTWRNLTALTYHYETQPIPNPLAYYARHLPAEFHRATTALTLAIELLAPCMIIAGRRLRVVAAVLLVGLQISIAATGNFAFFNLLSVALCVFLVDDATWTTAFRGRPWLTQRLAMEASHLQVSTLTVRRAVVGAAAIVIIPVSLFTFAGSLGVLLPAWQIVAPVASAIAPFRSVNSYGLFAMMTTTRPEIVVEGSSDGATWTAYEFKYKPGDLNRPPPWVAPHQPRLDWQMWFAALGRYEDNGWFQSLLVHLLEGSPDVLALLDRDPFNGTHPRYVRAVLYRYRFADPESHRATGAWWTRERIGNYSPVISLR